MKDDLIQIERKRLTDRLIRVLATGHRTDRQAEDEAKEIVASCLVPKQTIFAIQVNDSVHGEGFTSAEKAAEYIEATLIPKLTKIRRDCNLPHKFEQHGKNWAAIGCYIYIREVNVT